MFCTAFVLVATFSLILVFLLLLPSLDPTLWDFTGYVVIESRVYWEQLLYPTKVGVRFAYILPSLYPTCGLHWFAVVLIIRAHILIDNSELTILLCMTI